MPKITDINNPEVSAAQKFRIFENNFALQKLSPMNTKLVFVDFLCNELKLWIVDEFPLSRHSKRIFLNYIQASRENIDQTIVDSDLATIRGHVWSKHDKAEGLEKNILRIIVCGLTSGPVKSMDNTEENATEDFLSLIFGLVSRIGLDYLMRFQSYLENHPIVASVKMQS